MHSLAEKRRCRRRRWRADWQGQRRERQLADRPAGRTAHLADLHLTVLSVGKVVDASGAADGVDYRIVADAAAFAPLLQAGAFDLCAASGAPSTMPPP